MDQAAVKWTVFRPTSPSQARLPYGTSHSLRLLLHPIRWVRSSSASSTFSVVVIKAVCIHWQEQNSIAVLLVEKHYVFSELQHFIQKQTGQGTKLFKGRYDAFSAQGLWLACASGEGPQPLPPRQLADNVASRVGVYVPPTSSKTTTCKKRDVLNRLSADVLDDIHILIC